MFTIAAPFWSTAGDGSITLTPGTPAVSSIAINFVAPCICKINDTSAVILYQNTSPFYLAAVVATVTGTTVSFGSPVTINATTRTPYSIRRLNPSTNEFVAFSSGAGSGVVTAQVIEVSGTTITTPNVEYNASGLTFPGRGYGEVLSSTSLGMIFEAEAAGVIKVHGIAATVSAGVISFGTAAVSTMFSIGGGGGRPVVRSGELVQFGVNSSGSPSYVAAVGFTMSGTSCTASLLDMPLVVANRIEMGSTYGSGGTIDAGSGVVAFLYQDKTTGSVASVRGAWSGSAASYSNSDSNKNILPALPYPPPAVANIQTYGQVSPSGSSGMFMQSASGVISLYRVGIFGTVNMDTAIVPVVTSGAAGNRLGLVYLTSTQVMYTYIQSSGAFLGAGVCRVSG